MGYTHYWDFKKAPKGKASQTEKIYQRAILECQKVIRSESKQNGGLSGFAAHTVPGTYKGLKLNGSSNSGQCEDFIMREHYSQNESDFCKTGRYQYDTAVVACLIILKHRLGDLFEVSSDGDASDWAEGLELARKVLRLKGLKIPNSIRPRQVQCSCGALKSGTLLKVV